VIIYRVERLVRDNGIGHFEVIGYVRRDYYNNHAAVEAAEAIPQLERLMRNHGIDTPCHIWDKTHELGDSITSWIWRVRTW